MIRRLTLAALALLAGPALTTPILAQDVAALPGGASALSERHGSWSVNCSVGEKGKECGFSQSASNPQTGSALVALELAAPAANTAEGMLLMAFGLRLDAGVQLGIDGQPLGGARPFLTCISSGCLVPMAFEDVELAAPRSARSSMSPASRWMTASQSPSACRWVASPPPTTARSSSPSSVTSLQLLLRRPNAAAVQS